MTYCAYSISSLYHAADIDSQVQVLIQQIYLFIQLSGFHLFHATLSHKRMQCVCQCRQFSAEMRVHKVES